MKIKINDLVLEVQEGDSIDVETKDDFSDGISETIDHWRHEKRIASYAWHEEDGWQVATK